MKKIYLIIAMFILLFLSSMVYFIVTIDKSFNQKEKVMIETKKDSKKEPFNHLYFIEVS